jgi:uncharacterized protein DUF4349
MSAIDRNELDGYEALVSELRASAPVAPDSLRQRVFESAPAARVPRSRKRRLFLVVVPVAVVLAVGSAFLHGFLSTRSRNSVAAAPNVAALAAGKATHPALGGSTAARSVKTRQRALGKAPTKGASVEDYSAAAPSTTVAATALHGTEQKLDQTARNSVVIPKNRLVHAVASLQVQVKSRSQLSARTNEASQIVGSFGGYAQSVRYENSRSGYGEAVLALRVPVEKAQAAIAKLSTLGRLLSQQVSTQDLQTQLSHENSGIGSLRRAITVYEQALASATLSATERVNIEIRLNNARHALAQLRHARTGTLQSGATADISLLLTTRNGAIVVHHHHKTGRLGRLLGSAAGFLGLEGIIVLYALVVLSPIILLGALAWWIVRERRRREDRLLASA